MNDNYDYHNHRNFEGDTFDRLEQESAMPFVTSDAVDSDGHAMITHAHDDAEYRSAAMDCTVSPEGDVTTRAKAGPANMGGDYSAVGGTP